MNLIAGGQIVRGAAHPGGDAPPVLGHGGPIVAGAHTGVQAVVDPGRGAADAGGEAVPHAGAPQQRAGDGSEGHDQPSNPGTTRGLGEKIAQALKSVPIWSSPISRSSCRSITGAASGRPVLSAAARGSMPSRRRNSPWPRQPVTSAPAC